MNLSPTELTSQLVERLPIRHSPGVSDALALAGAELARLGLDHDVRPYGDAQQITATHAFSAAGPHVIVNAHIDIEPFLHDNAAQAPREPGRVYGPGASDMLGGIAATIAVLRGLSARDGLTGRITVQLVVGAHQGGAGTTDLLAGLLAGQVTGQGCPRRTWPSSPSPRAGTCAPPPTAWPATNCSRPATPGPWPWPPTAPTPRPTPPPRCSRSTPPTRSCAGSTPPASSSATCCPASCTPATTPPSPPPAPWSSSPSPSRRCSPTRWRSTWYGAT
ncbi:M20/M25/M40 family metallo-hydrolase [Nonomuraea thailandensis]